MFPLFIAHVVFWIVLLVDVLDARVRRPAVFLVLWVIGYFASRLALGGGFIFASYTAILDIVLVLAVFRGKVR